MVSEAPKGGWSRKSLVIEEGRCFSMDGFSSRDVHRAFHKFLDVTRFDLTSTQRAR